MKYNSKIYLKLIVKDNNCHNKYNSIIAAFIYDFESHSKYYYNFSHGDVIADTTFELFKKEIESGNYIVYNEKLCVCIYIYIDSNLYCYYKFHCLY